MAKISEENERPATVAREGNRVVQTQKKTVTIGYATDQTGGADDIAKAAGAAPTANEPVGGPAEQPVGDQPSPADHADSAAPTAAAEPAEPSPAATDQGLNQQALARRREPDQPEQPEPGPNAPDQPPSADKPKGEPAKAKTSSSKEGPAVAKPQGGGASGRFGEVSQALKQFSGKFSNKAISSGLNKLAMNPATWEIIGVVLAVFAMIAAIVLAFYWIQCTVNGTCTGRDTTAQQANAINDEQDILITLAKEHNPDAKLKLFQKYGPQIRARAVAVAEIDAIKRDAKKLAAIKAFIKALDEDLPRLATTNNPADPKLVDARKRLFDSFKGYLDALGDTKAPLVILYLEAVNQQLTGTLTTPYDHVLGGHFKDWRAVSQSRGTAGLHYGYDVVAKAGTPVIAGHGGRLGQGAGSGDYAGYAVIPWAKDEFGIPVIHTDTDGRDYQATYGHVHLILKEDQVLYKHKGKLEPAKTGAPVDVGDQLGTIMRDHVDIKWKRMVNGKPGPYVDWGTPDYLRENP